MRKLLYNRCTKFIIFVLILVSAGGMIYHSVSIAEHFRQYREEKEEAYDVIYPVSEVGEEIQIKLMNYLNRIIETYIEQGIDGVEQYYFNVTGNGTKEFNVIVGDENGMFSSFPDTPVEIRSTGNYYVQYLFTTGEWRSYEIQYTLSGDIKYCIEYNQAEIYKLDVFKEKEAISEEVYAFLKDNSGKFAIRVASTTELERQYYYEREKWLSEYIKGKEEIRDKNIIKEIDSLIVYACVFAVMTIISLIQCGRTVEGKKELNIWERCYSEVHIAAIGSAVLAAVIMVSLFYSYRTYNLSDDYYKLAKYGYVSGILFVVLCVYYETGILIKKLINKRFFKDCLVFRIIVGTKKFVVKNFKKIYDKSAYGALPEIKKLYIKKIMADIAVLLTDIFVGALAIMILAYGWMPDIMQFAAVIVLSALLVLNYFYITLSIKEYNHLRIYNNLSENIDLIYNGKYGQTTNLEGENHKVLNQVANLSESFKQSVAKQVEAEKMQIELVANVSHDLKTPLTSIISYVDLLSKEELPPVAKDYVKVLEEKSARLKDIVSDVFDLAKATSGEQVPMEQLDGVVLINQVLSDMSDRIEESGKDLRVKSSVDTAPVTGNGQKLYRVFQNVIDNALKYSMPGTRIYLSAEQTAGEFKVTVKNISEYEIDYTEQEILSRFTRGDKSRHSEGNGLGLSIAKSFTELCGGTFEVKLDDDLFKVIIILR